MSVEKTIKTSMTKFAAFLPALILISVIHTSCGGSSSGSGKGTANGTSTTPSPYVSPAPSSLPNPITVSFTLEGSGTPKTGQLPGAQYQNYYLAQGVNADSRLVVYLQPDNSTSIRAQNYASGLNSLITGPTEWNGATYTASCLGVTVSVFMTGTTTQVGESVALSINTSSSTGAGTCYGSTTATPSFDFSNVVLSSGDTSGFDIQISNAYTYISSSSVYGNAYLNRWIALPENYAESASVVIHTDTTE